MPPCLVRRVVACLCALLLVSGSGVLSPLARVAPALAGAEELPRAT